MSASPTISPEKREQLRLLFVRGSEAMSKANYEYADFYFADCVLQDPGNPIYARTFLANLKKKFGEKKKTTSSLYAAGKKFVVDSKKPENLFKTCVETLKSNPWDISTLISTGEACDALGFHEAAIIYYESAVDGDVNHIGANMAYCSALREAANFDGAIACVRRMLKHHPEDREMQKMLKDILAEKTIHQGKYATGVSREMLEAATTEVPEDEDAMGRTLTIEEQIERRIKKNPLDTANYVELAQYYLKQSDFVKAEECYVRAAEVSHNTPSMVEGLLEVQKKRLYVESLRLKEEYENNQREESKSVFIATRNLYEAKSLELAQYRVKHFPNHMGYRYDYGMLLQKNEQVHEAIAEFQFAKADKAREGDCLLALGQCFQMIRQYKLAMTHYQEAVSALTLGESKKKAMYLSMKLAFTLEDYDLAESYGHQLAAIDFSYRDLGSMLEQITQRRGN